MNRQEEAVEAVEMFALTVSCMAYINPRKPIWHYWDGLPPYLREKFSHLRSEDMLKLRDDHVRKLI